MTGHTGVPLQRWNRDYCWPLCVSAAKQRRLRRGRRVDTMEGWGVVIRGGGGTTLRGRQRTEKSRHDSPLSSTRGKPYDTGGALFSKGAGWPADNNSFYVAITTR